VVSAFNTNPSPKRALVLGSLGMLGHTIGRKLAQSENFNVVGIDRVTPDSVIDQQLGFETISLDVLEKTTLEKFLTLHNFEAVINGIGLLVKNSENHPELAQQLNADFPHYLEKFFSNSPTKIIHISTDYVFSGANSPYRETAQPDNNTIYGRSKAQGEISNGKDLTLRTSIIGPELFDQQQSLFGWFLHQHGAITGYTRALWSGVTSLQLANEIEQILTNSDSSVYSGIAHYATPDPISKFELLEKMNRVFERNLTIRPDDQIRPQFVLVNTRPELNFEIPPLERQLLELKDWMREGDY
jgi:dTDP-4-dehydrorhamnose reductase